jgi:hypothetical protein
MRSWFKLTIPKGKRRKRAHKKFLKKSGTWDWLRECEKQVEFKFKEDKMYDKINNMYSELAVNGFVALGDKKLIWNNPQSLPDIDFSKRLGVPNA